MTTEEPLVDTSTSTVTVTHLRHIAISCLKLEESVRFFKEGWGLALVEAGADVAYFRTQSAEPYQLALMRGPGRAIMRIAFGVANRSHVEAVADLVSSHGGAVLRRPGPLAGPGGGYGVGIVDPDGRVIELSADVSADSHGGGSHGDIETMPTIPLVLAHVVCNTPDIDRIERFWRDVLGFRVSDWSEHQMVFMRCNSEHHSIAFNAADYASYNHTAWAMPSIDGLFRAQGRLRSFGTDLAWGPGRHGPGNQVFSYFVEPSGYVVELIADGVVIDKEESWEPRVWLRRPEYMDLWGTSGLPPDGLRAAMAGSPDPSYMLQMGKPDHGQTTITRDRPAPPDITMPRTFNAAREPE